jgi:hypothetical protein
MTMQKRIETTELTDQALDNVTGGSLAGLGLELSNSLPAPGATPGGPRTWLNWKPTRWEW